jgi:hypothetical protein
MLKNPTDARGKKCGLRIADCEIGRRVWTGESEFRIPQSAFPISSWYANKSCNLQQLSVGLKCPRESICSGRGLCSYPVPVAPRVPP